VPQKTNSRDFCAGLPARRERPARSSPSLFGEKLPPSLLARADEVIE
jgi:hypothetical protein